MFTQVTELPKLWRYSLWDFVSSAHQLFALKIDYDWCALMAWVALASANHRSVKARVSCTLIIDLFDFQASWVITFFATAFLDVIYGLVIGIAFSALSVVIRTQLPTSFVLGRFGQTEVFKPVETYTDVGVFLYPRLSRGFINR